MHKKRKAWTFSSNCASNISKEQWCLIRGSSKSSPIVTGHMQSANMQKPKFKGPMMPFKLHHQQHHPSQQHGQTSASPRDPKEGLSRECHRLFQNALDTESCAAGCCSLSINGSTFVSLPQLHPADFLCHITVFHISPEFSVARPAARPWLWHKHS